MDWQELESLQPETIAAEAVLLSDDLQRWKSGADSAVVVHADAMQQMQAHAASSSNEIMGILRGRALAEGGRTLTLVLRAEPTEKASETRTSVHMTLASWQQAWSTMHDDLPMVGWYHSHPGFGVFFSYTDSASQRAYFREPWQVGVVIDPHSGEAGAFLGRESVPVTMWTAEQIAG
ncbi:Mov34/MPN/PAD-1 family protein [Terriglobus sp. RCC_193]|uniref:Mov34/MPN/PAD-1 family protein n=1 Tax=Terriglobus sp. RCC_193 TaxID=3239218 RepID=UPI003523AEF5